MCFCLFWLSQVLFGFDVSSSCCLSCLCYCLHLSPTVDYRLRFTKPNVGARVQKQRCHSRRRLLKVTRLLPQEGPKFMANHQLCDRSHPRVPRNDATTEVEAHTTLKVAGPGSLGYQDFLRSPTFYPTLPGRGTHAPPRSPISWRSKCPSYHRPWLLVIICKMWLLEAQTYNKRSTKLVLRRKTVTYSHSSSRKTSWRQSIEPSLRITSERQPQGNNN